MVMSVPSPQILFFVDSYYYNSARVFLESIRDDYEYYAFSDQDISSDIAGFPYTSIDQIGNVSDICFDYVVVASENPDIVYDRIEQGLKAHEYQVMTFLEAADIILPFEGCINFMRLHASTLIPCIFPSKESNPAIIFRIVVLPAPLAPTITANSPFSTVKLTSCRASISTSPIR